MEGEIHVGGREMLEDGKAYTWVKYNLIIIGERHIRRKWTLLS